MQQQVQETITDKTPIHFGQYRGQRLIDIPNDYLLFLYENDKGGKITPYLKENIEAIRKGAMKERKKRFNGTKRRRY